MIDNPSLGPYNYILDPPHTQTTMKNSWSYNKMGMSHITNFALRNYAIALLIYL